MSVPPTATTPRGGPDFLFEDPCVMFALRQERRPFSREFRISQSFAGAPCWAKFCGPAWLSVLAVESGVGQGRTERALTWLLNRPALGNVRYRPKLVLAAGFCGGLQEDLRTGDLILATEIIDAATGESYPTNWPAHLPSAPVEPALHQSRMVTVPRLAATVEQKRSLAGDFNAAAVDMESAAVARMCCQAEIPFGCLRVVVDDASKPLSPRLVALLSAGRVSPWRLARALLTGPGLGADLWDLAKRSHFAAHRLAAALGEVLTLTLPWMQE